MPGSARRLGAICYGGAVSGSFGVAGSRNLRFRYGLVLGAALAALALAGCGRKGPLELPPSAAAVPQERQAPGLSPLGSGPPSEPASQRSAIGEPAGIASDGRAIAPVGEKRRIPLDVLID